MSSGGIYTPVAKAFGIRADEEVAVPRESLPPTESVGCVAITRQQLGGLPEQGTATIFEDRIHVDTSATVSLPFGLVAFPSICQ